MDKNKWLRAGVGILVLFLVGVFLKLARPVLIPFSLAFLFSFAVSTVLDFLVRRKVPKSVALILILLVIFTVFYLVGTVFYAGGKSLATELSTYTDLVKSLVEKIDRIVANVHVRAGLTDWVNSFNENRLGAFLVSALGPFVSFMSQLLLIFVFMIFILAGRGRMAKKIAEAFPPAEASTLSHAAVRINHQIQKYLAVRTLINLLIGILTTVVMASFGVRFAVVFGVLAFLVNYIPTLGATISVALPVLLTFFLEGAFTPKVVLVLVLLAGVHVALNLLLERRLVATDVSLSPLLVLFSLFFWAWLWGIPGMILAVPMLTAARIFFENVPTLRFLATMMDK